MTAPERDIDEITGEIVDVAYQIHTRMGPGLLESVYLVLMEQGAFRAGPGLDLLVEDRVVVELKSVEVFAPVHAKQVLTYLRLLNLPVGLLINFGAPTLKQGLRRIVNNYMPAADRVKQNDDASGSMPGSGAAVEESVQIRGESIT